MKHLNMERATDRYNGIMFDLCADHLTVGTDCGEDTENWNLRDMVSECSYLLSTYYDSGCTNYDMRYDENEDARKAWRSETGKLRRFIRAYAPFVRDMECTEAHCSEYDNVKDIAFRNKMMSEALRR